MKKNHIFTQTENINFYFEFKTNNKIQCFFLFQIVRLHSKQRCGTFFPFVNHGRQIRICQILIITKLVEIMNLMIL